MHIHFLELIIRNIKCLNYDISSSNSSRFLVKKILLTLLIWNTAVPQALHIIIFKIILVFQQLKLIMNITMFNKMTLSDLKIYLLNSIALIVSFSEIEAVLKIILLLGSIVYTAQSIYANYQENK